jgi:glycosyltransferase involved in cell wall biosynthesis
VSYPTISLVTPSFNQAEFLEETIRSVLDQNYPNLEYVIVDGGSTDGSIDIIKKYSHRLKYWISEPDRGHGHALNKGFSKTTGDIMAWLNSDDKYLPWSLETVADIFSSFPDVNWIMGTHSWWDDKGRMTHAQRVYKNIYDYLLGNYAWIQQESVFWRRNLWERTGGKINEDYRFMVDGELWSRFFLTDRLYHIDCVVGGYREHGHNRAALHRDKCTAEMEQAISWMRNNCGKAVLNNCKSLQDILSLRRNPQSQQASLPADIFREFSKVCEEAAYDRIVYQNRRWEKSKVRYSACQ